MEKTTYPSETAIKMCLISHPDNLGIEFIQQLLANYFSGKSSYNDYHALGVTISTLNLEAQIKLSNGFHERRVKIILVRINKEEFLEKIRPYYRGASVFVIIYNKDIPSSFDVAKNFFNRIKRINSNKKVSVVFIEVTELIENFTTFGTNENWEEDETPNGTKLYYHEIKDGDILAFKKILEKIIDKELNI